MAEPVNMPDGPITDATVIEWLDGLRANALTVNDGFGEPLATACTEAIACVTALRQQLNDVDDALGFGYFPSDGTGRVRAIRERIEAP